MRSRGRSPDPQHCCARDPWQQIRRVWSRDGHPPVLIAVQSGNSSGRASPMTRAVQVVTTLRGKCWSVKEILPIQSFKGRGGESFNSVSTDHRIYGNVASSPLAPPWSYVYLRSIARSVARDVSPDSRPAPFSGRTARSPSSASASTAPRPSSGHPSTSLAPRRAEVLARPGGSVESPERDLQVSDARERSRIRFRSPWPGVPHYRFSGAPATMAGRSSS